MQMGKIRSLEQKMTFWVYVKIGGLGKFYFNWIEKLKESLSD